MIINQNGDINGAAIPNCLRCNGTGKPHLTDNPHIKKCMCVLHYYMCPTMQSAGSDSIYNKKLNTCDCISQFIKDHLHQ